MGFQGGNERKQRNKGRRKREIKEGGEEIKEGGREKKKLVFLRTP